MKACLGEVQYLWVGPGCEFKARDCIPQLACEVCGACGCKNGRGIEAAGPYTCRLQRDLSVSAHLKGLMVDSIDI
jgi:hypothetical protein